MPIRIQEPRANPRDLTKNPAETTITAVVRSTEFMPTRVKIAFTTQHIGVTVTANSPEITVPAATDFTTPGEEPLSEQVRVSSTVARGILVSIDIEGRDLDSPTAPVVICPVEVNLL